MPLNFQHATFAQAKAALGQLLNDTGSVFYSDAEKGGYIIEALRFWGCATSYWRDRATFTTTTASGALTWSSLNIQWNQDQNTWNATGITQDNPWYDLPTFLPAQRGYNVTDSQVLQQIEYHLLEPPTVPYSGSSQFNQTAIVNALQKRRDQFLLETMCVLSHIQIDPPAPPIDRIILPDTTIGVRRAAWKHTFTGNWRNLPRSDEWFMLGYYSTPWTQQAINVPQVHSLAVTPPLTILVAPPPNDKGMLDLIVVRSGAVLNPQDPVTGVLLGIPDDFTWAVKFGALADLLGEDGPAKDPQRAAYCQSRYEQGVMLARAAKSVMFLYVDNVPQYCESLDSIDTGRPLWQNYTGNPPTMGAMAGLNLMAMVDPPGGQYGVTLDVVTNAVVPSRDSDYLQIGREELTAILGYAQHLACFKCGGAEFSATDRQYNRMLELAGMYNSKLAASTQPALQDRAQLERARRPGMIQAIQ